MTKINHYSKVELDLIDVKQAVISFLEAQFPGQKATSIFPLYSSPVGYYEDRFPSQRDFSGFDVTLEPEG
jgi:hypothetical protein